MLAVLMALVPIFCRLMAKLAGYVTWSQIELKTQSWYFVFQVVQVFLVATLSSAITSVINDVLANPGIVLNLLAENLPKASNFYISYFVLLGLSSAAGTLLNIGGFVVVILLGRILPGKTPRKVFDQLTKLSSPAWGSEFPKWCNLGVIAITYSGIAPLMLGFATVGFCLVYVAYRYNFLYVYETNIDTKGEAYSKALKQLLTGVFLSEICLIGLFAISTAKNSYAAGPLAIMCVMLLITIIFSVTLGAALRHEEARLAYTDPTPHNGRLEDGHRDESREKSDSAPLNGSEKTMLPKRHVFLASLGTLSTPNGTHLAPSMQSWINITTPLRSHCRSKFRSVPSSTPQSPHLRPSCGSFAMIWASASARSGTPRRHAPDFR